MPRSGKAAQRFRSKSGRCPGKTRKPRHVLRCVWKALRDIGTMRARGPPAFSPGAIMQDILVLGAGKIGALITGLLAECGDYRVQLADAMEGAAAGVAEAHCLDSSSAFTFDASDEQQLTHHVRKHKPVAVISGLPFYCNVAVAKVARA